MYLQWYSAYFYKKRAPQCKQEHLVEYKQDFNSFK